MLKIFKISLYDIVQLFGNDVASDLFCSSLHRNSDLLIFDNYFYLYLGL